MCNCGFNENDYPNPFNQTTKEVDGYYLQITNKDAPEYGWFVESIQISNRAFGLDFTFTRYMKDAIFIRKEDYEKSRAELINYLQPFEFEAIAATSSEYI
jgi:hypothetical protein